MINGDIPNGSVFNLQGETVENLIIDLTDMESGETIRFTDGVVTNLIIIDKSGVMLDINSITITNPTVN